MDMAEFGVDAAIDVRQLTKLLPLLRIVQPALAVRIGPDEPHPLGHAQVKLRSCTGV